MRRRGLIAIALLSAVWAVLALPHSAAPRGFSDLTVTKTAPENAYKGDGFDYTISLTYSGTTLSDEVTVTDALPSGINFISLAITNGTCSAPQAGTSGTVSCTMQFGPATASSIITIHVEAAQTGTFVNTVQTSTGQQASASTTVTDPPPPPPGSFQVTKTGPATVIMHEGQRSEKFPYTITIKYVGPLERVRSIHASWTRCRSLLPAPATRTRTT